MTVQELINKLFEFNPEAEVLIEYDGSDTTLNMPIVEVNVEFADIIIRS